MKRLAPCVRPSNVSSDEGMTFTISSAKSQWVWKNLAKLGEVPLIGLSMKLEHMMPKHFASKQCALVRILFAAILSYCLLGWADESVSDFCVCFEARFVANTNSEDGTALAEGCDNERFLEDLTDRAAKW